MRVKKIILLLFFSGLMISCKPDNSSSSFIRKFGQRTAQLTGQPHALPGRQALYAIRHGKDAIAERF